jgi:hypothetical protein
MHDVNRSRPDFFIDYHDADLPWAEWIAWQLEQAHYTVIYRHRDFRPGTNIVEKTEQAMKATERVIALLSPDYLRARAAGKTFSGVPVWTTTFLHDPSGQRGNLLPIRVRVCHPKGLLNSLIPINLTGLNEASARAALLDGVIRARPIPTDPPAFPGGAPVQDRHEPKPSFPPGYRPPIWNIPETNPCFTNREDELARLFEALHAGQEGRVHTLVVNGLGGIGKTRVAIEYAYSYKSNYEAVLWIDASNHTTFLASLTRLVDDLNLKMSKAEKQDRQSLLSAVKKWLENNRNWLLILDNIDDPRSVHDLIPSLGNGHVLLTAQTQAIGTIAPSMLKLDALKPEDAALLLLRRAKKIEVYDSLENALDSHRASALKLAGMLGNLPLMLDQAGAYIEETGIDVPRYLAYYSDNSLRYELLRWRGEMALDHRDSIVETWIHAFEALQQANPAAYDLLCLCAFLYHEAIPEEIITQGASEFLPGLRPFVHNPLQKDQAIGALRKYSLLEQNAEKGILSINPMVQEVLRYRMSAEERRQWAEYTIGAVQHALLAATVHVAGQSIMNHCPRYHSHVQVCARHMEDWNILSDEAAQLLYVMGSYLYDYAQQEHDQLLSPAEPESVHIAYVLESYATLLKKMQWLPEAERLLAYADILRATNAPSV